MMRAVTLAGACVAALTLVGCANEYTRTREEAKAQWEAGNVYPEGYKADLIAFLRTYLNDPTRVRSAGVSQPQFKDVGPGQRYVACVRYDARNVDGRYAGLKGGYATYVSGKLDRFFDMPKEVESMCKDAVYAPFPELEKLRR